MPFSTFGASFTGSVFTPFALPFKTGASYSGQVTFIVSIVGSLTDSAEFVHISQTNSNTDIGFTLRLSANLPSVSVTIPVNFTVDSSPKIEILVEGTDIPISVSFVYSVNSQV